MLRRTAVIIIVTVHAVIARPLSRSNLRSMPYGILLTNIRDCFAALAMTKTRFFCERLLIIILVLLISVFGCRKKPAPAPPTPSQPTSPNSVPAGQTDKPPAGRLMAQADVNRPVVKPQAEFDAQAKKTIDANNMKVELDRLEQEIQREAGGRPVR